jgi:hypothetical protein
MARAHQHFLPGHYRRITPEPDQAELLSLMNEMKICLLLSMQGCSIICTIRHNLLFLFTTQVVTIS